MTGDVVLAVEELTKLPSDVHEVRYRPTMSVFWRMRDRASGYTIMASDAGGVDIDADDDADDADDDQGDDVYFAQRIDGETLNHIDLEVHRGEAIAIVGRDETPLELTRVLSGMVAPTSGRVTVVGRICPGGDLLTNLAKREPHPRRAAAALASLVGIPLRHRRRYVRMLLDRVVDEDSANIKPTGKTNPLVRRVALAAQFDPWADVLVVDTWPTPRSFGEQFVEVGQQAVDRGAALLLVNPPVYAEGLCSRAVWMEHGVIRRDGQASEVLAELRHAIDEDRRRAAHVVHGFDAFLAIQAVEVQRGGRPVHEVDVDDDLDVVVHFETAESLESLKAKVSFRGARGTIDFEEDEPRPLIGPGRHALVVTVPAGCLRHGDYAIDAAFTADQPGGGKSRVAWPQAARVRIAGDPVDDALLETETDEDVPGSGVTVAPSWDYRDSVEV